MSTQAIEREPFRPSPTATVVAGGALLLTLIYASMSLLPTSQWFALKAIGAYLITATLVVGFASSQLSARAFGRANTVTLIRALLLALLVGLVYEPPTTGALWYGVVVATLALILDGVDGWIARRYAEASRFGARFDMETDAALMLVLAVLVWVLARAGAWILLAGAMRYAFIGASLVVARLRRPLPPSMRRKTACIVQLVALVVALAPIIPPALAALAAAAGLVFLSYSFARDVVWLLVSD
jgi:phosphatidylglycerophosphate synthase